MVVVSMQEGGQQKMVRIMTKRNRGFVNGFFAGIAAPMTFLSPAPVSFVYTSSISSAWHGVGKHLTRSIRNSMKANDKIDKAA